MERWNNTIYLNKQIYDKESILQGMKDFQSVCEMELTETNQYFCCHVEQERASFSLVEKEFSNYVLGLGVKSRRCLL